MRNKEIEIQVTIEKIAPLKKFLAENAKLISEEREIDQYYTPSHRNFLDKFPVAEWLRLRNAEGKYSITYKNWHKDKSGRTNHCDEYESRLEDASSLKKILEVLDFKPIVKVDKKRKKYRYQSYEIVIDKVVGLPESVEIEYKGKNAKTPAQITEEMVTFLKDLKVGQLKRSYQGYPFLLLFPEKAEYEEV